MIFSFVQVETGLAEEHLWSLTPAKLWALVDRINEKIKREDFRAGVLSMLVRAACGDNKAGVYDFFPQHKPKERKLKKLGSTRATASDRRAAMTGYINHQNEAKRK